MEMIGGTRGNLLPDPKYDAALVVGLCFTDDGGETHTRVALALRTERNERTSKIAPEAETAPMERDANPPDAMDATAAAAGRPSRTRAPPPPPAPRRASRRRGRGASRMPSRGTSRYTPSTTNWR